MELLKMMNISKSFYGSKVLDDVFFNVKKGEVHALLGENGAGKSTLMNILSGVYELEEGRVIFDGIELTHMNTKKAIEVGIAFVHQELNMFNELKVYENIFVGQEITNRFKIVNNKEMIRQTRELFNDLGIDLDPNALVEDLKVSEKQLLEIVKALRVNAKLIILDEPTTSLNNEEIEYLFDSIHKLKKLGTSFIFISHKMPEIFSISDSYTVLRNGKLIGSGSIAEATQESVTRMMVGSSYNDDEVYEVRELGQVVLDLNNVTNKHVKDLSFSIKQGEIFGVTGLQGSGTSELLQTIFGYLPIEKGEIYVSNQKKSHNGIKKSMRMKIAMLAANRKENSVIKDLSVLENLYISEHSLTMKKFHINNNKELSLYDEYQKSLNIRAKNSKIEITNLSGGNQQKVIIARWLNTDADILLFDNPTQGIDVGAKNEIYKLIVELSKQGKTIIVNTLEIPEIQKIADRCLVMYQGENQVILERSEISEERVMLHATNTTFTEEENIND